MTTDKVNFSYPSVLPAILIFLVFSGCFRSYQPVTNWEYREYQQSNISLQPGDVKADVSHFKKTEVAWVGIIQESEFYEDGDNYQVLLLLEHRYFDWKINIWDSKNILYPSMLGEGLFQTTWHLKQEADLEYFMNRFRPGNMGIVYAIPDTVIDRIVLVTSRYIRIFDQENIRTDVSDYAP